MSTNEASRVTDAMVEAAHEAYEEEAKHTAWDFALRAAIEAALASRPVETNPVASKIDPIHGDKREVIINALCASSNWMRGYAEAFVDDFVSSNEWQPIESAPKDGRTTILLLTPSRFPQVAWTNTWWRSGFSVECKPSHWLPIPSLPEIKP